MSSQGAWQQTFDFLGHRPIVVEPVDAHLSTDAGLLPIRQFDESIGLTEQFAEALLDRRSGPGLKHSYLEMTRSRVYGILAGYEDQNDHDDDGDHEGEEPLDQEGQPAQRSGESEQSGATAGRPAVDREEEGDQRQAHLQRDGPTRHLVSGHEPSRKQPVRRHLRVDAWADHHHGRDRRHGLSRAGA